MTDRVHARRPAAERPAAAAPGREARPDSPVAPRDVDFQAVNDLIARLGGHIAGASAPARVVAPPAVPDSLSLPGEPASETGVPPGAGFGTGGVQSAGVLYAGRPLPAPAAPVVAAPALGVILSRLRRER